MRFNGACNVDKEMVIKIIDRNRLRKLGMTTHIYGGDCPFCGHEKTFCLWEDKGTYRCYWCGCDGRFVVTPERTLEEQRLMKAKLESSEV